MSFGPGYKPRRPRSAYSCVTEPTSLKKQDMQKWVLENVDFLAQEYSIFFRRNSTEKKAKKVPSPSKKYAKVRSKIAMNLEAQERAYEMRI